MCGNSNKPIVYFTITVHLFRNFTRQCFVIRQTVRHSCSIRWCRTGRARGKGLYRRTAHVAHRTTTWRQHLAVFQRHRSTLAGASWSVRDQPCSPCWLACTAPCPNALLLHRADLSPSDAVVVQLVSWRQQQQLQQLLLPRRHTMDTSCCCQWCRCVARIHTSDW